MCIPLGTRNHFARDVGLDRNDPVAVLDAFVHREELLIDVARANGRLFLNNVSLGLYARLVHGRERRRRRNDAFARLRALAILFHRGWIEREAEAFEIGAAAGRLQAAIDGEPEVLDTPIAFTIEAQALRVLLPRSPGA